MRISLSDFWTTCMRQARKRISETMEKFIEDRKRNPSKQAVFLDVLLANKDLSHDDKVAFLLDSLLAGHETTSVLLSILVYFIGKSPSIIDQLKVIYEFTVLNYYYYYYLC